MHRGRTIEQSGIALALLEVQRDLVFEISYDTEKNPSPGVYS